MQVTAIQRTTLFESTLQNTCYLFVPSIWVSIEHVYRDPSRLGNYVML